MPKILPLAVSDGPRRCHIPVPFMVGILEISYALAFLSAALSLVLLGFSIATYRHARDRIMFFLIGGFSIFGAKSFIVGYALLSGRIGHETLEVVDNLADVILVLLIIFPVLFVKHEP
jgi:hypothetical protein